MKKITLLALAVVAGVAVQAQEVTLTQNTDDAMIPGGVACAGGDNAFYRAYDLSDGDNPYDNVALVASNFGVEAMDADDDLTVNVYAVSDFPGGFDSTDPPAILASGTISVGNGDEGSILRVDFDSPAVVENDAIIAVQLTQGMTGAAFFPGVTAEETAMAYITSTQCGIEGNPVSYDDIAFPDAHIILDLIVDDGDNIVGFEDNALSQVSVYPNPATDVLNVQVPASVEVTGVSMFDVLGKEVNASISNGQVNISNLVSGVYLLNVETTAGTLTEKVIKQ